MTDPTFYWYDFETFGISPSASRPCQFAGVRTNVDFEPVEAPLTIYNKLHADILPSPKACLVTGITPDIANQKGLAESEFAASIFDAFTRPNTCVVGYNNIQFDDEVTRFLFYRNFYDPYVREYQHGNSRWDLVNLMRATYALRPEGIHWPMVDGRPSFRLELLTKANGIVHENAHDAMSDVWATIAMARLVKKAQPKLFDYFFSHRGKAQAKSLLAVGKMTPCLHISSRFGTERNNIAPIVALFASGPGGNTVICYDLTKDPKTLLPLSVEQISERLYSSKEDLADESLRPGIKGVRINRCPYLAPYKTLRPQDAERLNISKDRVNEHLADLKRYPEIIDKLHQVFEQEKQYDTPDAECALYSGGFWGPSDKVKLQKIVKTSVDDLNPQMTFSDPRLGEMYFRYRARHAPASLSVAELQNWQAHCQQVYEGKEHLPFLSADEFWQSVVECWHQSAEEPKLGERHRSILLSLIHYAKTLLPDALLNAEALALLSGETAATSACDLSGT